MKNFDLLTQLKKYKPYNQTEARNVAETIDFLEHGENQFVRTNFDKHIVADAYLLNTNLDHILLTHHKTLNIWLPFGGHSDGERNSLNVALRETREESGIDNINTGNGEIFDVDIHPIPENKKKHEPAHKHIAVEFVFTTPETDYHISDESDKLGWFTIDDFFALISTGYYSRADRIIAKLSDYIKKNKINIQSSRIFTFNQVF